MIFWDRANIGEKLNSSLYGQTKSNQRISAPRPGKLVIRGCYREIEPFFKPDRNAAIQPKGIVAPVGEGVLQKSRPIKSITIPDHPVNQPAKRVPHRLVKIPLKDIPIHPSIQAVIKIPFFIK